MDSYKSTLLLFLSFFLFLSACKKDDFSFDETVAKHFKAIENRDLPLLLETVNNQKIVLILPSGKYSDSFEQYKKVNAGWFSDTSWKLDYTIQDKLLHKNVGVVIAKVNYMNNDTNTLLFTYFLTLSFKKEENGWKLFHDQNTLIK